MFNCAMLVVYLQHKQEEYQMSNQSDFNKYKSDLREITEIQCMDGNWNMDPYMQGMANGLILAESIHTGVTPSFKELPEKFQKESTIDWKDIAITFWRLLDHIDTAEDIAKDNQLLYRNLVTGYHKKRFEYIKSDGYKLFIDDKNVEDIQ